jgi:hypothetical protein
VSKFIVIIITIIISQPQDSSNIHSQLQLGTWLPASMAANRPPVACMPYALGLPHTP